MNKNVYYRKIPKVDILLEDDPADDRNIQQRHGDGIYPYRNGPA